MIAGILDTSVVHRLSDQLIGDAVEDGVADGRLALCAPVVFEVCFSARNAPDLAGLRDDLDAFPMVRTHQATFDRALEVQAALAETGRHPGALPNPGVLATSNAVGTPALLPDGSPSELSVPGPLRGESRSRLAVTDTEIEADVTEVRDIYDGDETMRPAALDDVDGHTDLAEVYPDDERRGE